MKVKDYFYSREEFELLENGFGFLETHPIPGDIARYYDSENYLSHNDRQKGCLARLYQIVKKWNLQIKYAVLNRFSQRGKLLDYGCGSGDFLRKAQRKGWAISGIEPSPMAVKSACAKLNMPIPPPENLKDFADASFDAITLWHVLEHVPDLSFILTAFQRILKPDGTLIIALPNHESWDAKYYKNHWAAYDVPRHLWHFSEESIVRFLRGFQFEHQKTLPQWFDSFYVSILSEKYKGNSAPLLRGALVGLWSNLRGIFSKSYSSQIYIFKKMRVFEPVETFAP